METISHVIAKKKVVYVIDDSESYQKILQAHLSQLGFQVISFFNVADCLKSSHPKPDVILLDQNLGDGEFGINHLPQLQSRIPSVPIVFLSVDGNITTVTEAIRKGAFDYIEKNSAAFVRLRTTLDNVFNSFDHQKKIRKKLFLWVGVASIIVTILLLVWYFKTN